MYSLTKLSLHTPGEPLIFHNINVLMDVYQSMSSSTFSIIYYSSLYSWLRTFSYCFDDTSTRLPYTHPSYLKLLFEITIHFTFHSLRWLFYVNNCMQCEITPFLRNYRIQAKDDQTFNSNVNNCSSERVIHYILYYFSSYFHIMFM